MSFLTAKAELKKVTPLPASITRQTAIATLHNHAFFLTTDPHLVKYEEVTPSEAELSSWRTTYAIPESVVAATAVSSPPVRLYDVTDHVPNPVWSSEVRSRDEFVDTTEGLWTRIRSPMGIVMETRWSVSEGKGEGEGCCELVQEVRISCNRMLMGIVRGQAEAGFEGIHASIVKEMVEGNWSKRVDGEKK